MTPMRLVDALQLGRGDVVAFVGAGGKTAALSRLTQELHEAGRHVIAATTTHLALEQNTLAPIHLVWPETGATKVAAALCKHGCVLITGPADHALGKWMGLSPAAIADLRGLADLVLVEADGARRLPFKAPAEHEPAIPDCATVVVVIVGLDVLGQPLDAAHVHRPERAAALAGVALGETVTAEVIARVLSHPQGGRKNAPTGTRLVALLNKAESAERLAQARRLATLVLNNGVYSRVLIGSLASASSEWEVFPAG
ncbi:MAG: selenium cofactor biosynthesis protein YqeC [Anaerolineales bacterium]|nr:selenium cofactor biosynthesis protein YqeC [Anaerolineales bacterium]